MNYFVKLNFRVEDLDMVITDLLAVIKHYRVIIRDHINLPMNCVACEQRYRNYLKENFVI